MNYSVSFPILKTERLFLRQLTIGDDKAIATLRSDDTINKYLERPKTTNTTQAVEFINKINLSISKNDSFYWAITFKNKLIGTICLWNISRDGLNIEIGFELLPDFHGKGLMQEALAAVIKYTFQTLNFKTVIAYVHADNIKSILLLDRNNFKRNKEPENKGELEDLDVYSLSNNW